MKKRFWQCSIMISHAWEVFGFFLFVPIRYFRVSKILLVVGTVSEMYLGISVILGRVGSICVQLPDFIILGESLSFDTGISVFQDVICYTAYRNHFCSFLNLFTSLFYEYLHNLKSFRTRCQRDLAI